VFHSFSERLNEKLSFKAFVSIRVLDHIHSILEECVFHNILVLEEKKNETNSCQHMLIKACAFEGYHGLLCSRVSAHSKVHFINFDGKFNFLEYYKL
jgi:hypothetical protein